MTEEARLVAASNEIAHAIASRDTSALARFLAPGFVYRTPGGEAITAEAFLDSVRQIPGEIQFVRVDHLEIDVESGAAIVTGLQHAQLRIEGSQVDDSRSFVDFFVLAGGRWLLRAAVGLPAGPGSGPPQQSRG
jgi:hypothetical protein